MLYWTLYINHRVRHRMCRNGEPKNKIHTDQQQQQQNPSKNVQHIFDDLNARQFILHLRR